MKRLSLLGKKIGGQEVIDEAGKDSNGKIMWVVRCNCGNVRNVAGSELIRTGRPIRKCRKCYQTTHGYSMSGEWHYLYRIWAAMKDRCFRKKDKRYKNYGGRGITICDEWRNDFSAFQKYVEKHLGHRRLNTSIDRINNDDNYKPGNIRWATPSQQVKNRSKRK